jgi:hypothetical protein
MYNWCSFIPGTNYYEKTASSPTVSKGIVSGAFGHFLCLVGFDATISTQAGEAINPKRRSFAILYHY